MSLPTSSNGSEDRARIVLAVNLLAAFAVILAIAAFPTGSRVVVVAPPWSAESDVIDIIAEAGGALVNGGRADWLAVAEGHSPEFVSRLFTAGALLVLDGKLSAACIKGNSNERT